MKKRLIIALSLALLLTLSFSSAVFATDPIVSVDVVSPGGSDVTVTTTGVDDSTWHPGAVGQTNTFNAQGAFVASYDSYAGNYGSLNTYVNASSTTGASFTMTDTQDFNILSANHQYNTDGVFTSVASGTTIVDMNLKSIGSMYCWSEATNPYWQPALQGNYIAKQYNMETNGLLTSTLTVKTFTTGLASISNSNIWGWGANENGTITTNYGGGTRSITANGVGYYQQYVGAGTSATSSTIGIVDGTPVTVSANLPLGGSINTILNFLNDMNATYSMSGK